MGETRIRVVTGDITQLRVDAVVTAANEGLRGGGGVDGAVHAAAGPQLLVECRQVAPCPTGEARITSGCQLFAKHVIHAVGPVYRGGGAGEADALHGAYSSSLSLASEHGCRTIAFPCISTGVYGYPKDAACEIALRAVRQWLAGNALPEEVLFCCFAADDEARYRRQLGG